MIFFIAISNNLLTLLSVFLFRLLKKLHMIIIPLKYMERYRNILRHDLELKWTHSLQTFYGNIELYLLVGGGRAKYILKALLVALVSAIVKTWHNTTYTVR